MCHRTCITPVEKSWPDGVNPVGEEGGKEGDITPTILHPSSSVLHKACWILLEETAPQRLFSGPLRLDEQEDPIRYGRKVVENAEAHYNLSIGCSVGPLPASQMLLIDSTSTRT